LFFSAFFSDANLAQRFCRHPIPYLHSRARKPVATAMIPPVKVKVQPEPHEVIMSLTVAAPTGPKMPRTKFDVAAAIDTLSG
jgi:hypothetical protein